ncbi:quinoprotein dehydrogenase-associated putative ABC transporter substrate-binding protein [Salinisphaera aquimarina]|uniref:Quinoprotein dehydrogenase-associated putative ABC transporter substrate-binding protein n=1 Tax=Salinisphaera aquimarina TaxID=2094031 RepID=A0ABV7ERK2_9GAMM
MNLPRSEHPRPLSPLLRGLLAAPLVALALHATAFAQEDDGAQPSPAADTLRVCADPSNMPFSNEKKEGFENKIAALLGKKLGVPVEYYWVAEQMGFGRNSLKRWIAAKDRYACDLVISAGSGFDVGKTTLPYYRSTFAMAFLKGKGLDAINTPQDLADLPEAKRKDLRIGVFAGSPMADWAVSHGMISQMVGYRPQSGGYDVDPSDMVSKDLVNGDIDIAMIWGPIAGYYAKQADANIKVVPFGHQEGQPYDFPVSMAVRYGNDAWLNKVQGLINDNRDAIVAILEDYGVPLVPLRPEDRKVQEDDDD